MKPVSSPVTTQGIDGEGNSIQPGRRWLVLVFTYGLAGTLAGLALSRFYFLGYGMAAMAIAAAMVGMLAVDYRAAIPAGVVASALSLLILGIDRFHTLYLIPMEPVAIFLVITFWILAGAIGSYAGARAFRQWGYMATIAVLAMVIGMFLVTTHSESSFITVQAATDPPAKSFGVDGVLYLKTFYLMKQGEDFYSAIRSAMKQDLRVDIPGVPDHPAQYFNYRLPTLHQLWVWALPSRGEYILSLLILLEIVAIVSAFLIVHKWTRSPIALLAPILLAPHYSVIASSWYFDFSELWSALLLVVAAMLFVSNQRLFAAGLIALAVGIRELFLFAPLGAAVASFLAGKHRQVVLWLVPIAVFMGLEAFQYSQITPYLSVTDDRTWTTWQSGAGLAFALNTLRFGVLGITTDDVIAILLLVLAVAGLIGVPTREQKSFFGILLVAPAVSFLFIGHGGNIGDAYWGLVYSSTMLVLVPMFFDLVLRNRIRPLN